MNNMNSFVTDAKSTLAELKKTLDRVNNDVLTPEVATNLRAAIVDIRELIAKAQRAVDNTNTAVSRVTGVVDNVRNGKGGISRLLNDPEVADNLAVFISQLRKRGVLWYSDQKVKKLPDTPAADSPASTGSKTRAEEASSTNSRQPTPSSPSSGSRRTKTTR